MIQETKKSWSNYFPCTKSIDIGYGISYRPHKHWAMNVYAGEKLFSHMGDASGCLIAIAADGTPLSKNDPCAYISATCSRPLVVIQRIYTKGDKQVSAVLSYPDGLSHQDSYFWEIYPTLDGDIDRFNSEEVMEDAIRAILC